ncbi:MAG TPA: sulfatase-like hydrolase/transferase [Vicinamibacterales bacterium]|jgi:choline-sulfatase|nr:sulfatase-like hydrolase/transferase [Vicinamibacterales bacterium]
MKHVCRLVSIILALTTLPACTRKAEVVQPPTTARNVLLITIDTLRADHVGAYGYARARTPALDALAAKGARFDRAFAAAPITLVSHASIMTGRYPPGHGARHNGMRVNLQTPTIAETLAHQGFSTAAFVAAFPLDRRFGLIKGFQTYGDRMPRGADGRPVNERPGAAVVGEALAWLDQHRDDRFFLWVHLFEPHAPYGNPDDPAEARRPPLQRYDDDIAEADKQAGRVIDGLGSLRDRTLIIAVADHGEAFGEHGEISHSLFTYDTTLRVPLIINGPGIRSSVIEDPVTLVDLAPTMLAQLGAGRMTTDGVDLSAALSGGPLAARTLYAESFAPLFDFGWSPLRTVRADGWKYIEAPQPELYDVRSDEGETKNRLTANAPIASALAQKVAAYGSTSISTAAADPETQSRLQALGYTGGGRQASAGSRPDPKDKRALAARIAEVTSGELHGAELERALREILEEDPDNPQANVRLGYVLVERGACGEASALFARAIAAHLPSVDAHLGLAQCQVALHEPKQAIQTLQTAEEVEPDNPVVSANLGLVLSDSGNPTGGIPHLERALTLDPDLHQARFALAIAYARTGRRNDAAREAATLLTRMPANAPQRSEVERLLAAVQGTGG